MALPAKAPETWYLCEASLAPPGREPQTTVLVLELAKGGVLAVEHGAGALKVAWRKACTEPLDRRPRRPLTLQVESEAHATALRGAMPGVTVAVEPRPPSVDQAIESLINPSAPARGEGSDKSWTINRPAIEAVAWAGARFDEAAPWDVFADDPVVVEAPSLGLEHGAAVVIGQNGTSYGFLLFTSLEEWERHLEWSERPRREFQPPPTSHLAFDLERPREIQPKLRRVLEGILGARRRLPVAMRYRDQELVAASAAEARLLAAVATAIGEMADEHGEALFEKGVHQFTHGPVSLSLESDGRYAFAEVEDDSEPVFGVDTFEVEADGIPRPDELVLLSRIASWCDEELEDAYASAICEPHSPRRITAYSAGLSMWPELLLGQVDGRSFVEHFREDHALTAAEEAILAAQSEAWTGIWEVRRVTPGESLTLVDHLTGTQVDVFDATASHHHGPGTMMCARVITRGGKAYLTATDPGGLGLPAALELVTEIRRALDWPEGAPVDIATARALDAQREICEAWEQAMFEFEEPGR